MDEEKFRAEVRLMREEWGGVRVHPDHPGVLLAINDPSTGILVGRFSAVVAEVINEAIDYETKNEANERAS